MTLGGEIAAADELSSLVLTLYRASRERPAGEFQRAALELIKPVLAFDSGWWGSGVITAESALSIHTLHLHQMSPDAPVEYKRCTARDPIVSAAVERGSGVYRVNASVWFSRKQRSLEYPPFLKNNGITNAMAGYTLNRNDGFASWISLFRANPNYDYSHRDQNLMQVLFPHLMEALSINRLLHLKQFDGSQPRFQLAIVDKRGMLYHAESGFIGLLREEFRSPITDRLPTDLIASLDGSGRYAGRTLVIQCSQSAGLLFLKARARLPVDVLSKRETDIAHLMAQGFDYRKISQDLNISPETVRSHFKNIYKKLHISNKAQLIAMLGGVWEGARI